MALDTSGFLLEGIRVATGNNAFSFPPRNLISDQASFNAASGRADYVILAGSTNSSKSAAEIADPDLLFFWSRNESTVTRLDYDAYSRRWNTMPGGSPENLGVISNNPRLVASVPDLSVSSAPFAIYIGSPVRTVTFSVQIVPNDTSFSSPTVGTVQISATSGKLNFNSQDLQSYAGQSVISTRQSFFDRSQKNGVIGALPNSITDYFLFLNPRPASGQSPKVRIGYGPLLTPIQVANEAALGSPSTGTFTWSLDTGRIRFSSSDLSASLGLNVYYDGVILGSFQLSRLIVGSVTNPYPSAAFTISSAIGATDSARFVVFAELTGQPRSYFITNFSSGFPTQSPSNGTVTIDTLTGLVYFSPLDLVSFTGWSFGYVDAQAVVERGVSVLFYRSGVNGSGPVSAPDFTIKYSISGQILQDGIRQFPFITLPVVPVVDSSLKFSISAAPSSTGTFTGDLLDGTDPSQSGLAYLLDLDVKQMKFAERKQTSLTLTRPSPTVKLPDAAISPRGLLVTRNGNPITPGTDFDFDPNTGLMEFTQPVGQNGINDTSGVTGLSSLPNIFTADDFTFAGTDVNRAIFIPSGSNQGYYTITQVLASNQVRFSPNLVATQSDSVDIRDPGENLVDRFWLPLLPPFKKLTVSKASSPAGPFTQITNSEFTIFPTTGQINLASAVQPNEAFQVTYVSLDSTDNGVTTTPTNRVEFALFKVRQEAGVTTVGSRVVTFNANGSTINTGRPIVVYLDGVTQDSSSFQFIAPGTITLSDPITDGQVVAIDYWIENAPGGNTSFSLLFIPVDVDFPNIAAGSVTGSLNGDQTSVLSPGSALLIADKVVTIISSLSYSSANDVTSLTFEKAPSLGSTNATIQACGPVNGSFRIAETNPVDVVPSGSNLLKIQGQQSYLSGMIVTLDGDPYYTVSATYDSSSNRTLVTLASPAIRNYVIPAVTRTIRPILQPSSSFTTSKPAAASLPFTLVKMGTSRKVLISGTDYTMSEGGIISLITPLQFGDSLYALYVARISQPAGTSFTFNYAHAISPDSSNGLSGQRLSSSYSLYAPDSFYYRIETFLTYLPEVQSLLKQSSQTSSGPDTASRSGPKPQDSGSPSLYFPEQNAQNVDTVFIRLLKFYNDQVNIYEDVLSDIDGRIVGGISGRFRFDGLTNNPPRTSYASITNDIDDQAKSDDIFSLTSLSPFTFRLSPLFVPMSEPNALSRLFPTSLTPAVAINGNVTHADKGKTIGSSGIQNIRSAQDLVSTRANSAVVGVDSTGTFLTLDSNGDATALIPPFALNQEVNVYQDDGTFDVLATVTNISPGSPTILTIDTPTTIKTGSVLHAVEQADSTVHTYTPGRDVAINFDNGNIVNSTYPPALSALQNAPIGNEILDLPLTFLNSDTAARKIPVLYGLETTDDGRVSQPRLHRHAELDLLNDEIAALQTLGNAVVQPTTTILTGMTIAAPVGSTIQFLNGPNSGVSRTVVAVINPTSVQLITGFTNPDATGSDFLVSFAGSPTPLPTVLLSEVQILSTNTAAPNPHPSALFPIINSELISTDVSISNFGTAIRSASGTTSGIILTDASGNFINLGVTTATLLYVPLGSNRGLYKITGVSSSTINVSSTAPYYSFPAATSTSYILIQPWAFLGTKNFDSLAEYLRETADWLTQTLAWAASPTNAGKIGRLGAIATRQSRLAHFISSFQSLVGSGESLYDLRYLMIDQRVNRKTGTLTKIKQAISKRAENQAQLVGDAKKLLITQGMI